MGALEGYSGGYPYLRIARHYGVDYGDVLNFVGHADRIDEPTYWERRAVGVIAEHPAAHALWSDLFTARVHFKAMQAGQISVNAPHGAARAPV